MACDELAAVGTRVEDSDGIVTLGGESLEATGLESEVIIADEGRDRARGSAEEGTTRGGVASLVATTTEVGGATVAVGRPRANAKPFLVT